MHHKKMISVTAADKSIFVMPYISMQPLPIMVIFGIRCSCGRDLEVSSSFVNYFLFEPNTLKTLISNEISIHSMFRFLRNNSFFIR